MLPKSLASLLSIFHFWFSSNLFTFFFYFVAESLTSCKALAKSVPPLPPLQPLLCMDLKGGQISQKVCSIPLFFCWALSLRSSALLAPAALGVPLLPHTHLNPHSAPCSRLSSSSPISVYVLLIYLPEVTMVTSSARARSLIQPTWKVPLVARFLKRHLRSCALLALPMASWFVAVAEIVLSWMCSLVPKFYLHSSHLPTTLICTVACWQLPLHHQTHTS